MPQFSDSSSIFELAWKSLQSVARLEAQEAVFPRAAISLAWRNAWIANEASWLDMLDDRNITSHTYRESTAQQVFSNLPSYVPLFGELHQKLTQRIREIAEPKPPK